MAGVLISYGFNPNPLRRGYNRTTYTIIPDIMFILKENIFRK